MVAVEKYLLVAHTNLPLLSHFLSDGTTIPSTSRDPVSNSMLAELEKVEG